MIDTKCGSKSSTRLVAPSAQLALPFGQVDVWVAMANELSEGELAAQFDDVLSDHERRSHGEFSFEKDRRRYLTTRSLVRYVLSRYVPIPPAEWRFDVSAFGQPFAVNSHPDVSAIAFNISHSDRVVLLGLARGCQLGIDVEDLRRKVPVSIAGSVFSAPEVRQLHALSPAGQPQRFLEFWTLKESYIKARGRGLSLPLDKFSFELTGKRQFQVYFDPSLNDSPDNWTFWQWSPSRESIAALCVENKRGLIKTIKVRRTVPFVREEEADFAVLRMSAPVTEYADRITEQADR